MMDSSAGPRISTQLLRLDQVSVSAAILIQKMLRRAGVEAYGDPDH